MNEELLTDMTVCFGSVFFCDQNFEISRHVKPDPNWFSYFKQRRLCEIRSTITLTFLEMESSPRNSQGTENECRFHLSMLSPVWRAKMCMKDGGQLLSLDKDDLNLFTKAVALASGVTVTMSGGLEELITLGIFADQYQIEAIQGDVENAVMDRLTVKS